MFRAVEYGAVESLPTVVKLEDPLGLTLNSTDATPETGSTALTEKVTVPVRVASATGLVIEAVGPVLSTILGGSVEAFWLLALSVTTDRRS